MGVISIVFGFSGFGFEFAAGIVIGYFLFVNVQPNDVKVGTFLFSSFLLTIYFFLAAV